MERLTQRARGVSLAVFMLLLISQIPARTLVWLLPEQVKLSGLSGTIWSGQGARAWVKHDGKPLMLGRLQWRLQPWRMFWSTPLTLSTQWGEQTLHTRAGLSATGSWLLRDTHISIDARIFRLFFPLYLGGTVSAHLERIEITDARIQQALGGMLLREMVWTARGGNLPLGTYRINLADSGSELGEVRGAMETIEGALVLTGGFLLSDDSYDVSLRASGPVAREESFRRAVSVLATPTANGFDIFLQGQL
ncbi:MAG: type II secretion system protein N [Luminiphilus sp.]|nr:type II secretion system protein N [Luminiphilus sp.]